MLLSVMTCSHSHALSTLYYKAPLAADSLHYAEPVHQLDMYIGSLHVCVHVTQAAQVANLPQAAFHVWLPDWRSAGGINKQHYKRQAAEGFSHHGQDLEDLYAENTFFPHKLNGVYLETGALGGTDVSNSLYFNQRFGWKGVLSEPSPLKYAELVLNRPGDICINAAVCSKSQSVQFIDANEVGGIYEFMSPTSWQQWHPNIKDEDIDQLPVVACHPLAAICPRSACTILTSSAWMLEVAELEVLSTFPFDTTTVGIFCIEADEHAPAKNAAVIALLETQGYSYHGHVVRNDWFVHSNFQQDV